MMLERCPWYIAGPLFGFLVIGLRAALNKPFGAIGGYIDLAHHARRPSRLTVPGYLLGGFIVGGALFTVLTQQWPLAPRQIAAPFAAFPLLVQIAVLALAGVAIGFGARTAGGCTSGHGISGMSLGSPASFVATMTFFVTAVAVAHAVAWLTGTAL